MSTPPEWGSLELTDLANDYLQLVEATQGGTGDPRYRPHAASQRAVYHDQILVALGLTRDDPFDVVAWATATVAAAERQAMPFETNQPLERYRLHHAMRVAAFAAFLGVSETDYLALVAGDAERAAALRERIAACLHTSPWLINELAPVPDEGELDEIFAAIEEGEKRGYWRVNEATSEMEGPVFLEPELSRPAVPDEHFQLAEALATLIAVHPDGADEDYLTLRDYLEGRIRSVLQVGPDEVFDVEAWADDLLDDAISLVRQRSANPSDGREAAQ